MKGDVAGAITSFRKALQQQPSFAEARFNLGVALLQRKDFAASRVELHKVFETSRSLRLPSAYHLGLLEQRAGNLDAAEEWLRKVIAEDPDHPEAHLLLGTVLEARGDLQGAGRAYRQFLRLRPDSALGHLRFGVAAMRSGNIETARRYLRHTIELAPSSAEAIEARKFLVIWE